MRTVRATTVLLAALALTTACGTAHHTTTTTPSPSPSTSTSRSAAPRPTPTPEPLPTSPSQRAVDLSCQADGNYSSRLFFRTLTDAWTSGHALTSCEATKAPPAGTVLLAAEEQAVKASGGRALAAMYAQCARPRLGYPDTMTSLSRPQVDEASALLLLCPDHPDAATVQTMMTQGEQDHADVAAGRLVYAGLHHVGTDIQVGTYVAESTTGFQACYWEALDPAGEILDNGFHAGAFRVEMTVPAGAYSVRVQGCGGFRLQG
ncbi:hypothetical protein [Actinomyces sp. HMT897]|uniref:hypothetical protein n=1 Tax=Actinomyces sp. HMT897 TaxID=2789424 RepID=UPI00190A7B8A|nr:hypothetical protein [Actinomyces sp. HMT897]QQO78140.1 hypothetical protein JJJ15_01890 [Actinomyces sp. HMT897]